MSSVGIFLFMHMFTALLPPAGLEDENEYYKVLGFDSPSRRISQEDIRKKYRALSLELHPDKIAQRGGNAAEAAARYEKVRMAYSVLSDPKERRKYHSVNCSVARYKFVYHQGWMHPMNLLQNMSKASFFDRFRLVMVMGVGLVLVLLQPILLAAKINAILDKGDHGGLANTNWNLILIPFYSLYGLAALLQFVLFLLTQQRDTLFNVLQNACYLAGVILLVQEWENAENEGRPMSTVNWFKLAAPFYLAVGLKAAALSEHVQMLTKFQEKLVSPERMTRLQHEKQTEAGAELTDEQLDELREAYIVVNPNDLEVATTLALLEQSGEHVTDDDIEDIKVGTSPEWHALQKQLSNTQWAVVETIMYGVTLISLICAKTEGRIDVSWWVVFVPLWVYLGLRFTRSCCTCCLTGMSGSQEEILTELHVEENETKSWNEEGENNRETESKPGTVKNDPVTGEDAIESDVKATDGEETKIDPLKQESADDILEESTGEPAQPERVVSESEYETKIDPLKPESADDVLEESPGEAIQSERVVSASETIFAPSQSKTFFDKADEERDQEPSVNQEQDYEDQAQELDEEEAFRQWQRQHAQEADNAAIEAAANAQWTCCTSVFQIISSCLVVAKLEDAFDGNEGFSAFWVLFPAFLICGLLLCCCCFLVYGTPDVDKMEEYMHSQAQNQSSEGGGEGGHAESDPVVVAVPPPTTPTPTEQSGAESKLSRADIETGGTPATVASLPEPAEDINDLD